MSSSTSLPNVEGSRTKSGWYSMEKTFPSEVSIQYPNTEHHCLAERANAMWQKG